jgi:DNA-directed RNA polymerase specialized sigma24 family protein
MMHRPLRVLRETEVVGAEVAEEPRSFEDSKHARLFGALCLVTGDRHEAEEIMQDAFLRLWERGPDRGARRSAGVPVPHGHERLP